MTPPAGLYLALVLLAFGVNATAQHIAPFVPAPFLDTIPADVHERLTQRLEADKQRVDAKGKEGRYIKSMYDDRFAYITKIFNDDYFLTNDPLTEMVRRITDRIYTANPHLPRDVNVYVHRSQIPNAVSYGEGTFAIMLGLIERLETEDQLAFVMCHELAHYYRQHAELTASRIAALQSDKDIRKEIRDIRSSVYNRYARIKDLLESINLSTNHHSRQAEFEADSLGLTYYLNTDYDRRAPLRVMEILDGVDEPAFKGALDLRSHFSFEAFPFNDKWDRYSPSELVYASMVESETDTMKTHPSCDKRLIRLQDLLGLSDAPPPGTDNLFEPLRLRASFETLQALYHFREYGRAFYVALVLSQQYPDHPYPQAMVSKTLYQLFKAQEAHKLHKVLAHPHPRFDENYNRVLSFLGTLRLHEIANLAYEYATSRPVSFYKDEEMLHALWQCSRFKFSKLNSDKVAQEYETYFPKGRYLNEMQNR
jgi:Zn-dependent protease with chaperone function